MYNKASARRTCLARDEWERAVASSLTGPLTELRYADRAARYTAVPLRIFLGMGSPSLDSPGRGIEGGAMVRRALVAGILIALNAPFAMAQTADDIASLRKDIEALKEGQAAVLR